MLFYSNIYFLKNFVCGLCGDFKRIVTLKDFLWHGKVLCGCFWVHRKMCRVCVCSFLKLFKS